MIKDRKELHGKDGCWFDCARSGHPTDEGTVCVDGTAWREQLNYWYDDSDVGKKVIFVIDGVEQEGTIMEVGVTMGDFPVVLTTIGDGETEYDLETEQFRLKEEV